MNRPTCPFVPRSEAVAAIASLIMAAALLASLAPIEAKAAAAGAAAQPVSEELEEVQITGSRIVREGYEAPTPLAVIDSAQLETSANSNLAQYVTTLPVFIGSQSTRSSLTTGTPATAGTNSVNLRGLGAGRTLVLVDGHRLPAVHPSGLIDISAVPQQLIQRVDVVTGGASAVYGSDAITGVVNFILNQNFTGLKIDGSTGITNYGDGKNSKVNLAGGMQFAGGRGHMLLSGEIADDSGIHNAGIGNKYDKGRRWTNLGAMNILNPNYGTGAGQSTSVPQRIISTNIGYSTASPGGVIISGPLKGTQFLQGGAVGQMVYGDIAGDPFMRGGDWAQNDIRPWSDINPSERRQSAFGRLSYKLGDNANVYAQVSYIHDRTIGDCCAIFMPATATAGPLIAIDNAYLPDSVRTRMVAAGITSFRLGTVNQDLDVSTQVTERTSTTYAIGADGQFDRWGSTWRWDLYAQRGETSDNLEFQKNISRANYNRAVDAVRQPGTNSIVCRSTLTDPTNGCSPWNVLGVGVNTPGGAAWNYVHKSSTDRIKVSQDVYAASIAGEPFSMWAGPVSVALSAEHRRDTSSAVVDALSLAADHIYANFSPISGDSHVTEGALETVIPLASGLKLANKWDLNAAVRYTNYSLAGGVTTWKLGTTYSPVPSLKFRATRSRDIRAPTHQELFQPRNVARNLVFDPFTNRSLIFDQVTVGNTLLKPEKADTLGVGLVVQPTALPGFSLSADYWNIKLNDAISNVGTTNVLNLCFNGTRPDLCKFITRDSSGLLVEVVSGNVNLAFNRVRGIDFEASYAAQLSNVSPSLRGSIRLHANVTRYLENYSESPLTDPSDTLGTSAFPKWRHTASITYDPDPLSITVSARGFSAGTINNDYIVCSTACPVATTQHPTANMNSLPGRVYWDASIQYRLKFGFGLNRAAAYFNVRNIGDQDPGLPISGNTFGNGAASTVYDTDGTNYRAGLRLQW